MDILWIHIYIYANIVGNYGYIMDILSIDIVYIMDGYILCIL